MGELACAEFLVRIYPGARFATHSSASGHSLANQIRLGNQSGRADRG